MSVKFYIPGLDLWFALSQAAAGRLPALPRDARRGTAISAVAANSSAHTKAPRKAEATWEAKVPAGKGSTVPEVNLSAAGAALPEVQPSAAGAGACWAPSAAAAAPGTAAGSSRAGVKPAEGAGSLGKLGQERYLDAYP